MNQSDRIGKKHAEELAKVSPEQRQEVLDEARATIERARPAARLEPSLSRPMTQFKRRRNRDSPAAAWCRENNPLVLWLKSLPKGSQIVGVRLPPKAPKGDDPKG